MRIEIILLLITGFLMANIYTDGKYLKILLSGKKYYQMAGVAIGALMIYWLIKKNPLQAKKMISASNEYIKFYKTNIGVVVVMVDIIILYYQCNK